MSSFGHSQVNDVINEAVRKNIGGTANATEEQKEEEHVDASYN